MGTARVSILFLCLSALSPATIALPIVQADIDTGQFGAAGGGLATMYLHAFSFQGAPDRFGPNATVTDLTRTGPRLGDTTVNPVPGRGQEIAIGKLGGPAKRFSPTVGVNNIAKTPPPALSRTVRSISGEVRAGATYQTGVDTLSGDSRLSVLATKTGDVGGDAAAQAIDPVDLNRNTSYVYQFNANALLRLEKPDDFGGLVFFALDSRYTDLATFFERGQPLEETLWSLTILVTGQLKSAVNLDIDFNINDMALLEGALVLPSHSDGTPFTEGDIEGIVKEAFRFSDATTANASFSIFPANTFLRVNNNAVQHGAGLMAGLSSVPEPGTVALIALGALILLGNPFRRT